MSTTNASVFSRVYLQGPNQTPFKVAISGPYWDAEKNLFYCNTEMDEAPTYPCYGDDEIMALLMALRGLAARIKTHARTTGVFLKCPLLTEMPLEEAGVWPYETSMI